MAATFLVGGSFSVPEVLVGNIAPFLAFYSVGPGTRPSGVVEGGPRRGMMGA